MHLRTAALSAVAMVAMLIVGCSPPRTPYPASLQSERPEERIQALKMAAERDDREVVGIIVDRLEDEDEAVRLFAILALEKMTGTRLGYEYHAPEAERYRQVMAWRRYLRENQGEMPRQAEVVERAEGASDE